MFSFEIESAAAPKQPGYYWIQDGLVEPPNNWCLVYYNGRTLVAITPHHPLQEMWHVTYDHDLGYWLTSPHDAHQTEIQPLSWQPIQLPAAISRTSHPGHVPYQPFNSIDPPPPPRC